MSHRQPHKNGLVINPNTTHKNQKIITSGSSESKLSNHKKHYKSQCSSAIATFRKACFISNTKPIFPKRYCNKIS